MKILGILVVATAGVALLVAGIATGRGPAKVVVPVVRPCVAWAGPQSQVAGPKFERIRTQEQWEKLWLLHTGEQAQFGAYGAVGVPVVDFDRFEVVACFRGDSWNSNGEHIESIEPGPDRVLIRYDSMSYQTAGPDGGGVKVKPFGIWVIDRTDMPIVMEENVQGLIGQPPIWKEMHRFDGPGKK